MYVITIITILKNGPLKFGVGSNHPALIPKFWHFGRQLSNFGGNVAKYSEM